MRYDSARKEEKSPCSIQNAPMPETFSCPQCADSVEVWTDEEEATCGNCGCQVIRRTTAFGSAE
jgi:transcription elongation factor Elf1